MPWRRRRPTRVPRPVDILNVANVADTCDIGAFEVQENLERLPSARPLTWPFPTTIRPALPI